MELSGILGLLWFHLLGGACLYYSIALIRSGPKRLNAWALREGLTIVKTEWAIGDTGPFRFHSRGHRVYRVRVRTQDGDDRDAWVRTSLWATEVEVAWAEPGVSVFR